MSESNSRIESKDAIKAYLSKLKYMLNNGAELNFQRERIVDLNRDVKFTNKYTVGELFPNENPKDALKRELQTLTVKDYMRTVKDLRFPEFSEMREFGKVYEGHGDVYIKIRVELFSKEANGNHCTFVMSFHFAERAFSDNDFPYKD